MKIFFSSTHFAAFAASENLCCITQKLNHHMKNIKKHKIIWFYAQLSAQAICSM